MLVTLLALRAALAAAFPTTTPGGSHVHGSSLPFETPENLNLDLNERDLMPDNFLPVPLKGEPVGTVKGELVDEGEEKEEPPTVDVVFESKEEMLEYIVREKLGLDDLRKEDKRDVPAIVKGQPHDDAEEEKQPWFKPTVVGTIAEILGEKFGLKPHNVMLKPESSKEE